MLPTEVRTAVILITGFLGAGKTTWINTQLREGGIPEGSLILVNDFGRLQVDADLITARDDQIIRLANGCICCVLGDNLAAQLSQIANRRPLPTAIYIEGSGVAKAAQLQQAVHIHPHLRLQETICLIDAGQVQRWAADAQTYALWQTQIRAASRVVVNRMQSSALHPVLHSILQEVTRHGLTLVDYEQQPQPAREPANVSSTSTPIQTWSNRIRPLPYGSGQWTSISLFHSEQVDAQTLQATLHAHKALLRAKGWLRCQHTPRMQLLQYTAGQTRWAPAHAIASKHSSQLLCIGLAGEEFQECMKALSLLGFIAIDAMGTNI